MKYKSGSFAVPAATGSLAITGVGFQPDGVFFFGSNQPGLDSPVNSVPPICVFGGMMARDWNSSNVLARSSCWQPSNRRGFLDAVPIRTEELVVGALNGYYATATSLDADGFTVNFAIVPAGATRYVHWLAWGEADNAGAEVTWSGAGDVTLALGWRVLSLLTVGGWDNTSDGVRSFDSSTGSYGWYGGGSYPLAGNWQGVFAVDALRSQQRVGGNNTSGATPTITENYRPGSIGTILGGQNRTRPGVPDTNLFIDYVSSIQSFDMQAFWDGDSSAGSVTPVDLVGATVTEPMVNPLVEDVAAVLFFTTGDTDGFGTTLSGNLGFGVATPDHQACMFMDGSASRVFQSITKGWCCDVSAAGAVAGTVELADQEFTLETTVDSGPAGRQMFYMAFGPREARLRRKQEIYRRPLVEA